MPPAVFLDRDGTLIHDQADPGDPQQVRLIRGAASAVASLRGLGYVIVVVTNQPEVANGRCTEQQVTAVHAHINQEVRRTSGVAIDRFYYCPYSVDAAIEEYRHDHPWYKPHPGMLLQAAKDLQIDLSQSWIIGDRITDVEAGAAAGTRTILLSGDVATVGPPGDTFASAPVRPDFVAPNLIEAVKAIASKRKPQAQAPLRQEGAKPTVESPASLAPPAVTLPPAETPVEQAPPRPVQPQHTQADHPMLEQILLELKANRPHVPAFSFARAMAVGLQITAAICFLGAFAVGETGFARWLASAAVLQLATIAALLFDRR